MKVLIIDNYDSFTYNLYQYIGEILKYSSRSNIIVKRNNKITIDEIKKNNFKRIIISPGPGTPEDTKYFGICKDVILKIGKTIPILGVCLGMQGIAHCFGGKIKKAPTPMHGKTSIIRHNQKGLFKDLPDSLEVMRYHSLIIDRASLPKDIEITAETKTKEIMGIKHKKYPIEGIQFHPESFSTEGGKIILKNFLEYKL